MPKKSAENASSFSTTAHFAAVPSCVRARSLLQHGILVGAFVLFVLFVVIRFWWMNSGVGKETKMQVHASLPCAFFSRKAPKTQNNTAWKRRSQCHLALECGLCCNTLFGLEPLRSNAFNELTVASGMRDVIRRCYAPVSSCVFLYRDAGRSQGQKTKSGGCCLQ